MQPRHVACSVSSGTGLKVCLQVRYNSYTLTVADVTDTHINFGLRVQRISSFVEDIELVEVSPRTLRPHRTDLDRNITSGSVTTRKQPERNCIGADDP